MYCVQKALRIAACLSIGVTGNAALAEPGDDHYAAAARFYSDQQWQSAADSFRGFRTEFPNHQRVPDATFFTAEALLQLKQYIKGREEFLSFVASAPEHEYVNRARFRAAEALFLHGDQAAAAQELRAFGDEHPRDTFAAHTLAYRAEIALRAGENAEAEAIYQQILKQFPDGPLLQESRFGIARVMEASEYLDEAVKRYREVAAHRSISVAPQAALRAGVLLYRQQEYEQASEVLASFETDFANHALQHEARYWIGMSALDAGNAQDAAKVFETASRDATDSAVLPGLRFGLAKSKSALEDQSAAHMLHEEVVETWPQSMWAEDSLYILLRDSAQSGDVQTFDRLAAKQHKIATTSELSPRITRLIAREALRRQQLDRAAEAFAVLGRTSTNDAAKAAILRARSLEQADQPDAAVAAYRRAMIDFGGSNEGAIAMFEGAKLQDELGQDREAADLLQKLLADYPEFARRDAAIYQLGWALYDLQQFDRADAAFEQLLREFPQSNLRHDALYRLAEQAFADSRFAQVDRWLALLLNEEPQPVLLGHALYLQGQAAAEQLDWAAVTPPMRRILNDMPDHPNWLPANFWIAEANFREGNLDRAAVDFGSLAEATLELDAHWVPMVSLRVAQVAAHQKRWGDAVHTARKISQRFPDFPQQHEADYLIGRSLSALGRFSEARDAFSRVVRSRTGSQTETAAMAQWMIGESFFHQKEYRHALRSYQRVNRLHSYPRWHSASLLQTGKCQEALGDSDAAIKSYVQLIQRYPESEFSEAASARLRIARQQAATTATR